MLVLPSTVCGAALTLASPVTTVRPYYNCTSAYVFGLSPCSLSRRLLVIFCLVIFCLSHSRPCRCSTVTPAGPPPCHDETREMHSVVCTLWSKERRLQIWVWIEVCGARSGAMLNKRVAAFTMVACASAHAKSLERRLAELEAQVQEKRIEALGFMSVRAAWLTPRRRLQNDAKSAAASASSMRFSWTWDT